MKKSVMRPACLLLALLLLLFGCMCIANGIQTDHGRIDVAKGSLDTAVGELTFKLYVPETATAEISKDLIREVWSF